MKRITILALMIFLASAISVQAQRIAVVDLGSILETSSDYKAAQDELDKIAARWRQEIAQEYDVIKGLYNKYQAEQVLMSDDMRKQKEDEIMKKEKEVRELQKARFGPEGSLFRKRQDLVEPIQQKVYGAVEEFASKKGYDFVFDKASSTGILFSNPDYDKTEDVLKMLRGE